MIGFDITFLEQDVTLECNPDYSYHLYDRNAHLFIKKTKIEEKCRKLFNALMPHLVFSEKINI